MAIPNTPTSVHLPTGSRCDAGRHALKLCFNCGMAPAAQHLGDAECCACRPCPCCKTKEEPCRN